jgi:hypothetical protein
LIFYYDAVLLRRSLRELQRPRQRLVQAVQGPPVDVSCGPGFFLHQRNQPLVVVGPGAIVTHSQFGPDFDNLYTMAYGTSPGFGKSYTMAYGTDPDPYGAITPYQVPYNTYNPNYPSIPGINNSFAPASPSMGGMPQQDFALENMMQQFGMIGPRRSSSRHLWRSFSLWHSRKMAAATSPVLRCHWYPLSLWAL